MLDCSLRCAEVLGFHPGKGKYFLNKFIFDGISFRRNCTGKLDF